MLIPTYNVQDLSISDMKLELNARFISLINRSITERNELEEILNKARVNQGPIYLDKNTKGIILLLTFREQEKNEIYFFKKRKTGSSQYELVGEMPASYGDKYNTAIPISFYYKKN